MKNSFLVPVVFIINFILWLVSFSIFAGIREYLTAGGTGYFLLYSMLHTMYLTAPLACIAAIFSVYVFLMRHYSKRIISFLLFAVIFGIFFAGVIPLCYSQGKKINSMLNAQTKETVDDKYLIEFIEPPAFIQAANKLINPVLNDMYFYYTKGYLQYLLFAGSFFFVILSFWICTVCTDWKIINFSLLPFLSGLLFYAYGYAKSVNFIQIIQNRLPLNLPQIWIFPICFTALALLFFAYTGLLLLIRYKRSNPHKRMSKIKKVKQKKPPKPGKTGRIPRQSRMRIKEKM
ncbi:hypothetical protein [Treponema pedis]|uniref:Uncharacterized protein n=1 Tax=Treponema pedis TaxID=409322 RepID=A0A7S6WNU7_9SPIR|nr:hypothetical protein [Treponema pedis]QOW60588.1 hypothetical protein IFE08_12405 [Treponema pedis]QSI03860.1 hypothetical protein DYQ05_02450 [Treponema pedis]